MQSLSEAWQKEREVFENYKKTNPELFTAASLSEKEILSQIGIDISLLQRPQGYVRLYLQDFIVEEILENGEISEVEPRENTIPPLFPPFTLYANLIKIGISTSEALNSIAEILKITSNKIGYAGLKDIKALTSQTVAFSNIDLETFEKIKKISSPKFFLTDFSFGKGSLGPGELFGNRFTVLVRTKEKIAPINLSKSLERLNKNGFLNFYQIQRFGTPRYLSHFFGRLILEGKYKEAVLAFLTSPGLKEIPLIKKKRGEAKGFFGEWGKMEKIFEEFSYTFRNELKLLSYLEENPKNFIGALKFLKEQTTLWIYAYTSYLFNLLISSEKSELPEEIPLCLSEDPDDRKIYEFWFQKDGTGDFLRTLQPFRFIKFKRRFIKTKIFPQKISFKTLPKGVALSFILEKGVYATTFLMNLFDFKESLPLPEWVDTQEYDIKNILGIGSIEKIKEILKINS